MKSFPKGAAFADWLLGIEASQIKGQLPIEFPRDNLQGRAIHVLHGSDCAPADQACGRAAYTNLHVSADGSMHPNFPLNCEDNVLSAHEKAIAFILFE